jgi:Tfp pilus assembly protein PilF
LKAVEINPQEIKPYMALANFYETVGDREKTLASYQKARELEPENDQIRLAIARYYLAQRAIEDAEKQVTEILTNRPNYFPARLLKAEILIPRQEYSPAIEILDQLIKEDPRDARVHYFKGFAHFTKGEVKSAKLALATAVDLQPTFIKAQLLLAEAYLRTRDIELAKKENQFEKIIFSDEEYADFVVSLISDL